MITGNEIFIGLAMLFVGLLAGCPLLGFLDATQTEFFLKSRCVLEISGDVHLLADLDCDEFFNARDNGMGDQYCFQEAEEKMGHFGDVGYDLNCFQACCVVDGSCYGCQSLHECFCTARKGVVANE